MARVNTRPGRAMPSRGASPRRAGRRLVRIYAPLPAEPVHLVGRSSWPSRNGPANWPRALQRATGRLSHARIDGIDWYWPAEEAPRRHGAGRLGALAGALRPGRLGPPPLRAALGLGLRFEAYTPAAKRTRGYYALPLLWRDRVIGWANASVKNGTLQSDLGYVAPRPARDRVFLSARSRRS